MMGPPRLLHSKSTSVVRNLLAAGCRDSPSARAARSAAGALGIKFDGFVTGTASSSSVAPQAQPTMAPTVLRSASAGWSRAGLLVGKWVAIGLVGGAGASGMATWFASPVSHPSSIESPKRVVSPRSAQRNPNEVQEPPHLASPLEAGKRAGSTLAPLSSSSTPWPPAKLSPPLDEPTTKTLQEVSRNDTAHDHPVPARTSDDSLATEVRLIDEARNLLKAHAPRRAVDVLDTYASRPRSGTLDREAQLLRIQGLVADGRLEAARTLARGYLQAYPADPLTSALQRVIVPVATETTPENKTLNPNTMDRSNGSAHIGQTEAQP